MKYVVALRFDAVQWVDIEASSPEEAAIVAYRKAGVVLCNECARRLEVGEYLGCQILNENGEMLLEENV